MPAVKVVDAVFVTSAVSAEGYPSDPLAEIAFAGRSNVGKSSMINALTGRRKLVRVSKTPGRTRTLNFFDVWVEVGGGRLRLRLTDLPGYGFAKVSKAEHQLWDAMITNYLKGRPNLRLVVGIVDAEVGALPSDHLMVEYLRAAGRTFLVVATKVDRLGKAKQKPAIWKLAEQLGVPAEVVIPFSATAAIGIDEVWERVIESLPTERADQATSRRRLR
ncbi:MAG TPA: ribosome biogenesis GTP-binding protein YihA/YsxC [Myxococcaceae bacterium]|nr:ribosome biogenesis GTP-binding protein YihA/YsxC [Myxococcaceae bacterium]